MSGRPILSVLIPTRNRAYYLKHAIQSAINIPEKNVEILVSENHSSDNSWEVCAGFKDPRLTILRPDKPLPMHQNWEYLLNKASGEWVYFLGDDDAMMPHAASHLDYLTAKYLQCEAIVSPRAYYFWNKHSENPEIYLKATFGEGEAWVDSKEQLRKCLDGKIDYLYLPQIYSGGFQRRTLINRVKSVQNGVYFKSVTPDAYSAVMGCAHTFRHLRIEMPLAWVGTSPSTLDLTSGDLANKDRAADFWGMHDDQELVMHRALGDLKVYTFALVFYEAYISAIPTTSMWDLSADRVRSLYHDAVKKFRESGNEDAVQLLGKQFGIVPPKSTPSTSEAILDLSIKLLKKPVAILKKLRSCLTPSSGACRTDQIVIESKSFDQYPIILCCDEQIASAYLRLKPLLEPVGRIR